MHRREFLSATIAGAFAAGTGWGASSKSRGPVCVFTKPLQSLSYDDLAMEVAALGFDGIEAPVRRGGHFEPPQVETELPKLTAALAKRNLKITVMTSDVNNATDALCQRVLKTAAKLGIERYRMKYLRYVADKPIRAQLANWKARFRDLAALNKELGIRAVYQNHAGAKNLGASLWDLAEVLDGIAVEQIGVAYDIRHATVEGGQSWPITFRMIRPHIDTVYVKDFQWEAGKPQNVPLGDGHVSEKFFEMLAKSNFTGPISLHEEYLDHRKPELVPKHLAAIKQDFATLKKLMRR